MKRIILTLTITFTFLTNGIYAQIESDFLTAHINTFFDLHNATIEFENQLLDISDLETAKKSIDEYSIQIEKSIEIFSKYEKSDDEQIKEVSTDLGRLLSDILNNNYLLLGKLIKTDYSKKALKKDCKNLVDKNQFASNFFGDITVGVCMSLAKEKPEGAKENQQFLKLTEKETNEVNKLLFDKYGKTIKQGTEVESRTPFENSCRLIYEFINMKWEFEEESK